MVRPVVPEAQASRVGAGRAPHDLVTEADPEQGPSVVDDGARQRDLRLQPRRITRPGRQDHPVDVVREDVGRGRRMREDPDACAAVPHRPDDVRLEAQVHDPDPRAGVRGTRRYSVTAGGDTRRTKSWSSQRVTARAAATARSGSTSPGAVTIAAEAAVRAQVPRQRTGVDAGDGRDRRVPQQRGQLARVVEDGGGGVGDDERPQPRADRLVVGGESAVVADERIRHDHDLAGVGGVRADLLVAGLAGVDHEVAAGGHRRPERDAGEDGAVLQRQQRRPEVADPGIDDGRGARQRGDDHATADTETHQPSGRGGRGRALT